MRHPRKYMQLVIVGSLVIVSVLWFCLTIKVPDFAHHRLVQMYSANEQTPTNGKPMLSSEPVSTATILFWTKFFGNARWGLEDDTLEPHVLCDQLKCPFWRCTVTNRRDLLASVRLYDAILFHGAEMFPLLDSVPSERAQHQLYVFALMEPPGETKHVLRDEQNFYNLTMTIRMDSDIPWPYQYVADLETGQIVAPELSPMWRSPPDQWNDTQVRLLWPTKTKNVAWFVSHCKTLSRREELAEKLQRYIDVDIYGKCGPFRCGQDNGSICNAMLQERYKFYLAFENCLCTDYVSEKVYNALENAVVPVVFGGANYNRFLPPHSYIDAEQFESVKELAEYLLFLSNNLEAYMRYFWWRHYYHLTYWSPFCTLCARLHAPNPAEKINYYRNIEKWWLGDTCRFTSPLLDKREVS